MNNDNQSGGLTPENPQASEQADGNSTELTPALVNESPVRVLSGLAHGRIVQYILGNGITRPLLIVCAGDFSGKVAGVLFFKGAEDHAYIPFPLPTSTGHKPECSVLARDVEYDEKGLKPGTWHFPSREPVMAAGVDASAAETIVGAILEQHLTAHREAVLAEVNEKLQAHLITVNALCDTESDLVRGLLRDAGIAVSNAPEAAASPTVPQVEAGTDAAEGQNANSGNSAESATSGS